MSDQQTLATRWYQDILNEGKTELIKELIQPDALMLFALGERKRGADGAWSYAGFITSAIKNAHHEITHKVSGGDIVYLDLVLTGTHAGHLRGVEPTGAEIRMEVFSRVKVSGGKIASLYESGDLGLLIHELSGAERKKLPVPDQRIFPTLRSLDWEKSRAFYKQAGFEVQFEWRHGPGFPVYAGIVGHGVELHISEHSGDCEPGGAISIMVDDVDATHTALASQGVEADKPEDMPWGDRTFMIHDPDGNSITFFSMQKKNP